MTDVSKSIVRNITAILVGPLVALLASHNLGQFTPQATVLIAAVVSSLYATVVRLLEKKFPKVGYLLGTTHKGTSPALDIPSIDVVSLAQALVEAVKPKPAAPAEPQPVKHVVEVHVITDAPAEPVTVVPAAPTEVAPA